MTVCIAAMNRRLGVIVTAHDLMLSTDESALDGVERKLVKLAGDDALSRWLCLYAGDPDVARDLTRQIKSALVARPDHSRAEVEAEVRRAYDVVIRRRIEREVLAQQYGLTFEQFVLDSSLSDSLRDQIGAKITVAHERICNEMRWTNPTTLLVCGFDEELGPHIFEADGLGQCTSYDNYGFHAIGAGGGAARAWLLANVDSLIDGTVSEIAYRVFEAKFLADGNSPIVGKSGHLHVWFENGAASGLVMFRPEAETPIDVVRRAWTAKIREPPNRAATDEIERQLRGLAGIARHKIYMTRLEREEQERQARRQP